MHSVRKTPFLQSGAQHNCFIYSIGSKLVCWGNNKQYQTEVPEALKVAPMGRMGTAVGVATGGWHTCVLHHQWNSNKNQWLSCWGRCSDGQCHMHGIQNNDLNVIFNDKIGTRSATEGNDTVSEGASKTKLNDRDKMIKMFDEYNDQYRNYKKQKGTFHLQMASEISYVTAGNLHTCVLTNKGQCLCFGLGNDGLTEVPGLNQLDLNTSVKVSEEKDELESQYKNKRQKQELVSLINKNKNKNKPSAKQTGIKLTVARNKNPKQQQIEKKHVHFDMIAAGWSHNCGTAAHKIICWGQNGKGESNVPDSQAFSIQSLAAGMAHTCALLAGEYIKCWGSNAQGQLQPRVDAHRILLGARQVSCGAQHTCATHAQGGITCWGSNDENQCITPPREEQTAVAVAAGQWHTCALTMTDTFKKEFILCWGSDEQYKSDWQQDSDMQRNSFEQYYKMRDQEFEEEEANAQ